MEELQGFTEGKESNFDLKAEIYKYLAFWKWLILGILIGGFIAFMYNRYTIPKFRSESTLMILKNDQNNVSGILPSGGGGGSSIIQLEDNSLENQIVSLKSKRIVKKVVEELNFNVSYFIEGNVITTEAYKSSPYVIKFISPDSLVHSVNKTFLISSYSQTSYKLVEESSQFSNIYKYDELVSLDGLKFKITSNQSKFLSPSEMGNTVKINIRPLESVAGRYISKLEIGPKGKAMDILSLSLIDEESEKSEDFLNSLMYHFNADGVADKRQVALSTTEFIQERLEIITQELDSVEGGIAAFKSENEFMSVDSGAEKYINKSNNAEDGIFDLETQMIIINSIREFIESKKPYILLPSNLGIKDSNISGLISSYNSLVLERNEYLNTSTPQNPVVINLTSQLDATRANLLENIESSVISLKIKLTELNKLEAQSQSKFSTFPGLEKSMRGIERQQKIKEELYLFLLQRREEAAIAFAVTSPVAKIIDPAYTLGSPVDPKPSLILAGGLVLGLILPLGILFVVFMLDTKVHHKGDLNVLTRNIPFLGEIPKITDGANEVIQLNDRSPLAESFRILRTNLAYLIKPKKEETAEIIYVTSTIKGEGKTFISYNLAKTLATTNKKVVLIGADIRNPKLHRYTEESGLEVKGLSDYLHNYDIRPEQIVINSNEDIQVDMILSGSIPPNPAELFMSDRMKDLYNNLKQNYDFIIVDTAPTMIVTDTLLISPLADTTLYVTRAGYTDKKLLDFPKDLKDQGKLKGLAIVLNDVDYSKFSYGAKYGYSYGYGYGYGVDEESRWKKIINKFRS
jgi:tyrosine-protein kinase Etk/Wzc